LATGARNKKDAKDGGRGREWGRGGVMGGITENPTSFTKNVGLVERGAPVFL